MDKVKEQYDMGWRAYLRADGTEMFQWPYGDTDACCCSPLWEEEWHALRAYQDEQRKKGVPIVLQQNDLPKWRKLSVRGEVRTDDGRLIWRPFYFGAYVPIDSDDDLGPEVPYIKAYTKQGSDLGAFTNFRWREGYPK